jgi:purine-binding chemotaxis protein CheW
MSAALHREPAAAGLPANLPQRIVTFRVDDRHFGVDVSTVREIKGWQPTTPIPNAPPHVLGVVNLRGTVIAVHDLRHRIGLGHTAVSASSVVVIVDFGDQLAGVLVDAVSDIVDVTADMLRPPPDLGARDSMLLAIVVRGSSVIVLPDLAAMLRHSELALELPEAAAVH